MAKTLKELAAQAIQVQDACNASGVVHSFNETMKDLWVIAHAERLGTEWVNTHPIVTLYIDKLASLNGTQFDTDAIYRAYREVREIALD